MSDDIFNMILGEGANKEDSNDKPDKKNKSGDSGDESKALPKKRGPKKRLEVIQNKNIQTGDIQPTNWIDREAKAKTRKIEIEMALKIGEAIPKYMVVRILGQFEQSLINNFVDMAAREAETLAAQLGIPEQAHKLERLWTDYNHKALETVKAEVHELQSNEVYEPDDNN